MASAENDLPRPSFFAPTHSVCGSGFEPLGLAHQVSFASENDHTVNACRNRGSESGNDARTKDLPFENARRKSAVGNNFQAQFIGLDFVESSGIEYVACHAQSNSVGNGNERVSVPIEQATGFGRSHALSVDPPINVYFVGRDGLTSNCIEPTACLLWASCRKRPAGYRRSWPDRNRLSRRRLWCRRTCKGWKMSRLSPD